MVGIDDAHQFDRCLGDRIGAQPERLFAGRDDAERTRIFEAAIQWQQQEFERIGAAGCRVPLKGYDDDGFQWNTL